MMFYLSSEKRACGAFQGCVRTRAYLSRGINTTNRSSNVDAVAAVRFEQAARHACGWWMGALLRHAYEV